MLVGVRKEFKRTPKALAEAMVAAWAIDSMDRTFSSIFREEERLNKYSLRLCRFHECPIYI